MQLRAKRDTNLIGRPSQQNRWQVPPQIIRKPVVKRSMAVRRIVFGLLLLAGVVFLTAWSLSTIADRQALAASPVCPAQTTGPHCHARLSETVDKVEINTGKRRTSVAVYLHGSTPELGRVDLDDDTAGFARALDSGDTVIATIWHGKAIAVTANGRTVGTLDSPTSGQQGLAWGIGVLGGTAFLLLRSASRVRLWNRLGFEPSGNAPEKRMLFAYGSVAGAIGLAAAVLLGFGIAWSVYLLAVSVAAVLYGLVFPWLLPRFRDLFSRYGPENAVPNGLALRSKATSGTAGHTGD